MEQVMLRVFSIFVGLVFTISAHAVDVDFNEPIEATLTISSFTVNDEGMAITYSGEVGKYGLVDASHQYTPTNAEETKGHFTGSVQAISDEGAVDRSFTAGLYSRDGVKVRLYGFDDDAAARIMWVGDADLREKVLNVKVWELDR